MHSVRFHSCPNCHRQIEEDRLTIHMHMCSTIKLRQSRIFESKVKRQSIIPQFQNEHHQQTSQCLFCNEKMAGYSLELHMNVCQHRLVNCDRCNKHLAIGEMPNHLITCKGLQSIQEKKEDNQQHREENSWGDSKVYVQSLLKGISTVGSKLVDKSNKLLRFINENKGPAFEAFNKFKIDLRNKIEDAIADLASQPNANALPRDQIRMIPILGYVAKNNSRQQQQSCSICICQFQDEEPIKILKCKHIFHPECIDKWMKVNSLCPLCKRDQNSITVRI